MSARPPGRFRTVVGTNPAAGTEISETVPVGRRWRLIQADFSLVTSAVVNTRTVQTFFDDGTNVFYRSVAGLGQAASLARNYELQISADRVATFDNATVNLKISETQYMEAGYRFRTVTALFDVGDDYSAPIYLIEEWFTPP